VKEGRNNDRQPKSDYYFPSPTSSTAGGNSNRQSSSNLPFSSDKKVLLSVIDPDTWIGRKVYIIGNGKFNGIPAIVKSSGNGWVQIDSPLGELAKRAYELEVALDDSDFPASFASYGGNGNAGSVGSSYYEKQKAIISRKRPRGDSDLSTSSLASSSNFSCYRPVNARRSSSTSLNNNNYGDYFNGSSSFLIPQPHQQRWRSFSEIEEQRLSELEEERNRLPLRDASTLNHQRMHIMRYVTQSQERNRNRPNLGEWKKKINSSLSSYGGKRDEDILALLEHNHHGHGHGHHNVCEVCALEKRSKNGLTYCWNEFCPVSPVYYKIIGMLPKTLSSSSSAVIDSSDKENEEFSTDKEEEEDNTQVKRAKIEESTTELVSPVISSQQMPSIQEKSLEEVEEEDDETPSVFALPPPVVPIQNPNNSSSNNSSCDSAASVAKRSPSQQALMEMKDYQRDRSESLAAITDQEDEQSPYYQHDKDLDKIVVMNQAYQQQQQQGQKIPSASAFSFFPQLQLSTGQGQQGLLPPHYFAQSSSASLNPFLSPRLHLANDQQQQR
jgi:hypothetical protein